MSMIKRSIQYEAKITLWTGCLTRSWRWGIRCLLGVCVLSGSIGADYQKALVHYYQGRYEEAEQTLTDLEPPNARLLLSLIQLRQQQHEKARRTFATASESLSGVSPFDRVVRYWFTPTRNITALEQAAKRVDETETRAFQDVIYLELADAWRDSGRYDKATMILQKLRQQSLVPDIKDRARIMLVEVAIAQAQQSTAEAMYRELILANGTADKGLGLLIRLNQAFGTPYGVLDILKTPDNQLLYIRRLYSRQSYGDFRKMASLYLQRYPQQAAQSELLTCIGVALFEEGKYKESESHFKAVMPQVRGTSYGHQAQYYLARSIHRQKRYEDAKQAYIDLIQSVQDVSITPAAYYYLYWTYSELGDLVSYQPYLKQFKSRYGNTLYYDKIMWEYGWQAYLKRDYAGAMDIFSRTDWKFGSDLRIKVTYWMARIADQIDPSSSRAYYMRLLQEHPFSYYGYQVVKTLFPNQLNDLVAKFQPTGLTPDPIYLTLTNMGLGDLAATDLQFKVKRLHDRQPKTVYTLAYVYSKMMQNHKAIGLLSSLGFSINPKESKVSREIAHMLYPRPYWPMIERYSAQFGVDPYLALALMREESLFNSTARSRVGAIGLMQIMPETGRGIASHLKHEWRGEETLLDPETNIKFGVHYIASLSRRFNGNPVLILSGYNAGPNATRRWMSQLSDQQLNAHDMTLFVASIPYSETHAYVTKVLKSYWVYRLLYDPGFRQEIQRPSVAMKGPVE